MPRPVWSGTISFGLVAIPVKLFNAVHKRSVAFNQLDRRTMTRIKLRKVSAETGDEVPDAEIVKGYEVSKGRFVAVEPEELEPFLPLPTRSIDLEAFVELAEIDPIYFDSPYIVAPDGSAKPYKLLVQAMSEAGKVAVARFVMRNKQYVAALRAVDDRLLMSTMVYADELVDPAEIGELAEVADVEVTKKEVAMAESLVASLTAPFEPEQYRDNYREQVVELIERKAAGESFDAPAEHAPAAEVVDLMAALEASVKAAKAARSRHPATERSA